MYRYGSGISYQSGFRDAVFRLWGQLFRFWGFSNHLKGVMVVQELLGLRAPPVLILACLLTLWNEQLSHSVELQLQQCHFSFHGVMHFPNPLIPCFQIKAKNISKLRTASFASYSLDRGKLAKPSGQFLTSSPVTTHQAQISPSEIIGPSASAAYLRLTSVEHRWIWRTIPVSLT